MADRNDQTEEATEPHEHDAAGWAKHREAQRQLYRQLVQVGPAPQQKESRRRG
jgi:hypothetical protein